MQSQGVCKVDTRLRLRLCGQGQTLSGHRHRRASGHAWANRLNRAAPSVVRPARGLLERRAATHERLARQHRAAWCTVYWGCRQDADRQQGRRAAWRGDHPREAGKAADGSLVERLRGRGSSGSGSIAGERLVCTRQLRHVRVCARVWLEGSWCMRAWLEGGWSGPQCRVNACTACRRSHLAGRA